MRNQRMMRIKTTISKLLFTLYLLGIYVFVAVGAVGLVTNQGNMVILAFVGMLVLFCLIMYPRRRPKHGH
jgi:vacuolar-type H+-ATPase subunit I/STV1